MKQIDMTFPDIDKGYSLYYLSSSEDPTYVKYIAITRNGIYKRLKKHIGDMPHKDTYKDRWMKKVILNGYIILITELANELSEKKAKQLEIEYIAEAKFVGFDIVNTSEGGQGYSGKKHPDHIKKISIANTGKSVSFETRQKLRLAHKGKILSPQHREKVIYTLKRIKYTDERRNKIRLKAIGRKASPETIEKIRIGATGRPKSIKEINKRLDKISVPIIRMDKLGNILDGFKSAVDAAKIYGLCPSSITCICKGRNIHRKTAGGFKWAYYKLQEHGTINLISTRL